MHADDRKRLTARDFDRKSWTVLWDCLPDFARRNGIEFVLQKLHVLEASGRWSMSWNYETNEQREEVFEGDQPGDAITFNGSLQSEKPTTPALPKSKAKAAIAPRPVRADMKLSAQVSDLT